MPGHPRRLMPPRCKDVDARHKGGHDEMILQGSEEEQISRRPGKAKREPGPNHRSKFLKRAGAPAARNHEHLWLWVPAQGRDDTSFVDAASHSRSTIVTLAMPPPSHMVCRP